MAKIIDIVDPYTQQAQADAQAALARFEAEEQPFGPLVIRDNEDFQIAGVTLRDIVTRRKKLEDLQKSLTEPIDLSKKRIVDMFRPSLEGIKRQEQDFRLAISVYTREQEDTRRREEARLRDIHVKEVAEAEARAAKLRDKGREQQAEAVLDAVPSTPVLVANKEKVEGIGTVQTWKAEVTDLLALVSAVAAGKAPLYFLQANESALGSTAKTTKGSFSLPGVRFYAETTTRVRAN